MTLLTAYISIIFFIVGACVGSFLNALSERVYNNEDFVMARSHCNSCGKTLQPMDLIPVVSYLLYRGKCRYCHAHIPNNVFLSEVAVGILYVLSFLAVQSFLLQDQVHMLLYWCFLITTITFFSFIAIYDFKYYIIPDIPVLVATIVCFIILASIFVLHLVGVTPFYYANYTTFLVQHLVSAVLLFGFFLSIYTFTKGKGIGGGDVKMSFLIGLMLGAKPTIIFLYIAFFTGAAVSVVLILVRSKALKDSIPFGPFLAFGVIMAILYSGVILQTPLFSFINTLGLLL